MSSHNPRQAACFSTWYFFKAPVNTESTETTSNSLRGNSPGNISSDGVFAGFDDTIYFVNINDNHKIYSMKEDGTSLKKITDDSASYINIVGNWLYLSNGNDHSKLYKVMLNGSGEKQLNDDETEYINVDGNWIYYSNKTDNGCIYKIKTDGTGRQRINEVSSHNLILDGDYIYFININNAQ